MLRSTGRATGSRALSPWSGKAGTRPEHSEEEGSSPKSSFPHSQRSSSCRCAMPPAREWERYFWVTTWILQSLWKADVVWYTQRRTDRTRKSGWSIHMYNILVVCGGSLQLWLHIKKVRDNTIPHKADPEEPARVAGSFPLRHSSPWISFENSSACEPDCCAKHDLKHNKNGNSSYLGFISWKLHTQVLPAGVVEWKFKILNFPSLEISIPFPWCFALLNIACWVYKSISNNIVSITHKPFENWGSRN